MNDLNAFRARHRRLDVGRIERAYRGLWWAVAAGGLCLVIFSSPFAMAESAPTPSTGEGQDEGKTTDKAAKTVSDAAAMTLFLDRLMLAESGGRDDARNPRSTAVGAFQFIETTFLNVVRAHFSAEAGELSDQDVLKLRTNRNFARRAAEAFTRDNAAVLAVAGFEASFANLRLAHLVGPGGAVRVLKAPGSTPAVSVLGGNVARANPFLVRMTADKLVEWSGRNLDTAGMRTAKIAADPSRIGKPGERPAKPQISVHCNRGLASCRRWIALAQSRVARKERVAAGSPQRRR